MTRKFTERENKGIGARGVHHRGHRGHEGWVRVRWPRNDAEVHGNGVAIWLGCWLLISQFTIHNSQFKNPFVIFVTLW